jgi:hypothetical protein
VSGKPTSQIHIFMMMLPWNVTILFAVGQDSTMRSVMDLELRVRRGVAFLSVCLFGIFTPYSNSCCVLFLADIVI